VARGKYLVDEAIICCITYPPMHGDEIEKILATKYDAQNEIYVTYNTRCGRHGVLISEIIT
jgi:hypothetical protein